MATLYLMMGYPGAGKTMAAETIATLTGAIHLASDRLRVELFPELQFTPAEHTALYQILDQRTELLLKEGNSVIYDANLNRYEHRKEKYIICASAQADALLIWVQTDKKVAQARATVLADADERRPFGNLDIPTFERLVSEIEPPHTDESYIIIDGTKISPDYIAGRLHLNKTNSFSKL